MAALKLILALSTTLSKTFRTTRVGAKHSRPVWNCAKRAKNASFLIRAAAVMWRTGGRLSADSTIPVSTARVGSESSVISGNEFLRRLSSSIRRMPSHHQGCRTPDTCNRPRSEQSYLSRRWSRFGVVAARCWDYEQLLFESPSRRLVGCTIPLMRYGCKPGNRT
jgi:hypothetical protein